MQLAAVSFWRRESSEFSTALRVLLRNCGLLLTASSSSFGLSSHYWRLALTVSLYRFFGRPCCLLPYRSSPYSRRLGMRCSSILMTCPTQRSCVFRSMDSTLVEWAWSRTSRLVPGLRGLPCYSPRNGVKKSTTASITDFCSQSVFNLKSLSLQRLLWLCD